MSEKNARHHMTADQFRSWGCEAVQWIADYMERVEQLPVLSTVAPEEIYNAFPEEPPSRGESFGALLRDLDEKLMPGITHWQSPNFFGYFPANTSGPSILGEMIAAGLGVQGMLWATSPACTELEMRVLDWLVQMLGLPAGFASEGPGGGVIQDSASSATLCALLAARDRSDPEFALRGQQQPLAIYATEHAHSSLDKAVRIAGLGSRSLRRVAHDGAFAMVPEDLAQKITEDRRRGMLPCFVLGTVGTTSSNATDPLRPLGEICRREGAWLHVDAAMSGTAALCSELRGPFDGVDLADSFCFNPHKWMFTNFDCDCFWVRDRKALQTALGVMPEYLRNPATGSGRVIDYRDWHVPLGRRFRALKLFFVIRHYGVEGLQYHVRQHVELARAFAARVEGHALLELAAPTPFNLVCFRHRSGEAATQALLEEINASGRAFLTHARLDGRYTIRVSIGQTHTEARHVEALWQMIVAGSERLKADRARVDDSVDRGSSQSR